jgi:hypothetical protein
MLLKNGLSLGTKLMKVIVRFSAFKKQKKESFDSAFIRNFAPRRFDKFIYAPSVGALGGLLVGWNGNLFDGSVIEIQPFVVSINFSSRLDLNI